jgi:enoyl-CoA hydratase/carnithine racemase
MKNLIQSRTDGRIAFLTIDNPPQNLISNDVLRALKGELEKLTGNDFIRAIVLDSANNTPPFAADGAALLADSSPAAQKKMIEEGQEILTYVEKFNKPIVMAIYDGMCMGGGLELAFSCHIRVAGQRCKFSIPEAVAGQMPGWGNTQRLVRLFGRERTIEMILTGEPFTSEQALQWCGLNHVVDGAAVLGKATDIAKKIAYMRTKSIHAVLDTLNQHYQMGMAEGKTLERDNYMKIYKEETFIAAIKALFEQRPIEFKD